MDGHIHKNWREARRYLCFRSVRARCVPRLLSIIAGILFVLFFGIRTVDMKRILHNQLIVPHGLSEVQSRCLEPECGCIYVLGGSEGSLHERFNIAARLYHEKVAVKVMTLGRPGITAYDPVRGRNLTNDEWSREELIRLGVKSSDIEVIYAGEGFFGTLAEAKQVARLTPGRGYRQLILVTSEHHTRRAWLAFATNLAGQGIEVYAYMARDPEDLAMLAEEYVKLIVYRSFLL
jgi:uncharacterized SAM-binding protein YcdF (DUF218 family)